MSRISSPVEEVTQLVFNEMPSKRRVDMVAAVRVGRTHVFHDSRGNIYSTQVKKRSFYTLNSGMEETLTGCKLLGLVSREAAQKHIKASNLARIERSRHYAAMNFKDNAKELGLRLTDAQLKAVAAADKGVL